MKRNAVVLVGCLAACSCTATRAEHAAGSGPTKEALVGVWRERAADAAQVRELRFTADEYSLSTPTGCIANGGCANAVAMGAWSLAGDQLSFGDPPVAYTVATGGDGRLTLTRRTVDQRNPRARAAGGTDLYVEPRL